MTSLPRTSRSAAPSPTATDASAPPAPPVPRALADTISVAEAAKLVGKHEQTIRTWVKDGNVEAVKLGKRQLRVNRTSLLAFVQPVGVGAEAAMAAQVADAAAHTERPAGGLYDPEWGFFTRDPFHDSLTP